MKGGGQEEIFIYFIAPKFYVSRREYYGLIFNMKTSASHYYMFNRKYEGHKDDDNGTKLDINMM